MEASKDSVTGKNRPLVVVAAAVAAVEGAAGTVVVAVVMIMEETGETGTATALVLTKMNLAEPHAAGAVGTSTVAAIGPTVPVLMEVAPAMVPHLPRMVNLRRPQR